MIHVLDLEYMFLNCNLLSLLVTERAARLDHLPAWITVFTADFAVRLFDSRLRLAAMPSKRWRSPLCLVPAGLLLLVATVGSWSISVTWPEDELLL